MFHSILCFTTWICSSIAIGYACSVVLMIAFRSYKILFARRFSKRQVDPREAVLITGATSGIGLATARHLYKLGYSIVVGYYDSKEAGYEELQQLKRDGKTKPDQKMIFLEVNVRDQQSVTNAYEECCKALQADGLRLWALCNNAGIGTLMPFAYTARKYISGAVETNLIGTLLMTREFLPLLIKSKGRIINTASGLGLIPGPTYAVYGLTKGAQVYFTQCMNMELYGRYGVQSVAMLPHNYIKNTNIAATQVKLLENGWQELRQNEREMYRADYDEHLTTLKNLDALVKEAAATKQSKKNGNSTANVKQSTGGRQQQSSGGRGGILNSLKTYSMLVWEVLKRCQGQNTGAVEETGVAVCFEDAVRLVNPPEYIFVGDDLWNIVVSSLLSCLPQPFTRFLSISIAPSLYR